MLLSAVLDKVDQSERRAQATRVFKMPYTRQSCNVGQPFGILDWILRKLSSVVGAVLGRRHGIALIGIQ